ncbi:MAG: 50S ribosomal protein L9 [Candidatus Aminicenantes bacterium]|nr:50S ribosomal protein L9 [Candidatus Aminicenantes bacterium]
MKLLLRENIESLGKKGDIVDVAPGYGRNYLIPKELGIRVTSSNMKMIEIEQKALKKGLEKEMESYNEIIERLNNTHLLFKRKTSEKETIYGSVSANDIKEELDKLGFDIEKKRILLEDPIKKSGIYTVLVKVFHEHQGELKIEVKSEGEGKAKKEEEPEKKEAPKKELTKKPEEKTEEKPEEETKKKTKEETEETEEREKEHPEEKSSEKEDKDQTENETKDKK